MLLRLLSNTSLLSLKAYNEVLSVAKETIICLCAKSPLTSEKTVQGGAVTRAVSRIRRQTPYHSLHAHCRNTHTHTHQFRYTLVYTWLHTNTLMIQKWTDMHRRIIHLYMWTKRKRKAIILYTQNAGSSCTLTPLSVILSQSYSLGKLKWLLISLKCTAAHHVITH